MVDTNGKEAYLFIMDQTNYYTILGVDEHAETQEIKEAFRKLALKYHPDRNQGDLEAQGKMQRINEAYAVLSDPEKRRQYDAMYRQFGDAAQDRFRQAYTSHDLFSGSDIQQIFEELSRVFGVRGFDDIFRDIQEQTGTEFRMRGSGLNGKAYVFQGTWSAPGSRDRSASVFGDLARKMLHKMTGIQLPTRGKDIHDTIMLNADDALHGGPYAYYLTEKDKKLVVKIPPGVKENQTIRLAGMGHDGQGGAPPGDLMLKVKIRMSFSDRLKQYWELIKGKS
jgi:DnaJ-class molecular chaperone